MCLIIPKEAVNKKVTTRKRTVYKIVHKDGDNFSSPYYEHTYIPGKLYETEILECSPDVYYGETAKKDLEKAVGKFGMLMEIENCVKGFGQGFHYIATKKRAVYEHTSGKVVVTRRQPFRTFVKVVVKCIIPKGAEYYEWKGLGVTNKIIIDEEVV